MAEESLGDAALNLNSISNVLVVGPPDCMCQVALLQDRAQLLEDCVCFLSKGTNQT